MRWRLERASGISRFHFEQLPAGVFARLEKFRLDFRPGIEDGFAFVSHVVRFSFLQDFCEGRPSVSF